VASLVFELKAGQAAAAARRRAAKEEEEEERTMVIDDEVLSSSQLSAVTITGVEESTKPKYGNN